MRQPTHDPLTLPAVRSPMPRPLVRGAATIALICTIAGGFWGKPGPAQVTTLLVIDLSQSMRAGNPPRWVLARDKALAGLDNAAESIGLITCAARSRLAAAPASRADRGRLRDCLDQLRVEAAHPDLAPLPGAVSGTRLGTGLAMARRVLEGLSGPRRVVLISDGDDPKHDSDVILEAVALASAKIDLVVVPVGDPMREAAIPLETDLGIDLLEWQGAPVRTRAQPQWLATIAEAGGGVLVDRIPPAPGPATDWGTFLLAYALVAWIWYLAYPVPVFLLLFPLKLAVFPIILALYGCQQGSDRVEAADQAMDSARALLHQAANLGLDDPQRALVARQAESWARAAATSSRPPKEARLLLIQAHLLHGNCLPMDRPALLAALELALEESDPAFLNQIRWSLAQCPPPGRRDTPQKSPGPAEQSTAASEGLGDPGGSAPDSPRRDSGEVASGQGTENTPGLMPGTGRLPVLLDTRQPQQLSEADALELLRAALARQRREAVRWNRDGWNRRAVEVPDW